VRAELIGEFGAFDAEAKFENYRALGPAPWSVVFEHTVLLRQVRGSHGYFSPALVGACALGERMLHHLVDVLRNGPADGRIRAGGTIARRATPGCAESALARSAPDGRPREPPGRRRKDARSATRQLST
jgi:hypothetical protein